MRGDANIVIVRFMLPWTEGHNADRVPGKLVVPTSPRAKPDGKIHGAAKKKWVLVDSSTIPKGVIEELNQAIAADRAAVGRAESSAGAS